jgi:hypothetical protein
MSFSTDQKRTLAIDFGLPVTMVLLWAILPVQLYRHLYYIAHLFILAALLPVAIYAALALKEQGKRRLFVLAAGTSVFIVVSIAVIRYLDAKLMGFGIWF